MWNVLLGSAGLVALVLLWLVYRYALFVPAPQGLPILLYHKVSPHQNDALTISCDRLERQLVYLSSAGYTSISFADLQQSLEGRRPLPPKPVLVTFDDGYLSTYIWAYPLLVRYNIKATVFLPTAFLGGLDEWNAASGVTERLMSYPTLRSMAGPLVEFALHSHRHENYQRYSAAEIEADLASCIVALEQNRCPFTRVFAYPFGRMPKAEDVNSAMRESFRRHQINFAVRIGSRINSLPPRDAYELKRTVVRGTDSFREFKIKLQKGRTKLF